MHTQTPQEPLFDAQALAQKTGVVRQPEATEPLFEWTAVSHHDHARSRRWYAVAGGIAGIVAIIALLQGSWSVTVVTLVIAGMYAFTRHEQTPLHRMRIENDGFTFDDTFVSWKDCVEFWVVQTPGYNELHVLRKKGAPREIIIQTTEINLTALRSTLSQFLAVRTDQRERLLDAFLRLCKL